MNVAVCEMPLVTPDCELTILMPCLNEAETLEYCITEANAFFTRTGIRGEVVIADNGSNDGSQTIARSAGARVVDISARGYGSALKGGIEAARGSFVVMGDSDGSYDFARLDLFIEKLRAGFQLVLGNRFKGGIAKGAMPMVHRYLGNPVLTAIGRMFFRSPCGDFHCGLRGFDRRAILALDLQAAGMEFASEMIVKASVDKLRITEVATTLSPDGRNRPPHLRTWRDGWRHLRFLLLFSPRWLFLFPGFATFALGTLASLALLPGPIGVGGIVLDVHTLLYTSTAAVVGFQSVMFWVFAKVYGQRERIVPPDPWFDSVVRWVSVENALLTGLVLLLLGVALGLCAFGLWSSHGFGSLHPQDTMRFAIPSAAIIILASQLVYGAFFISLLNIRATHPESRSTDRQVENEMRAVSPGSARA
ncbi:glycosyltransferase family 2 protein [Rhodopila sp.]|uniref:glycosyltransferase family 2 protein n=1 Tax=Rhodopila sp. TaxID=2480087 RepID=UPI003D0B9A6B